MMFSVGEYIVHPGKGVCEVVASAEQDRADSYILRPLLSARPMLIHYPCARESHLRSILTAREAQDLIADFDELPVDTYHGKTLTAEGQYFKEQIKLGSCRELVCMVKTFIERIDDLLARNKKPPVLYERLLKEARTRSYIEIACALGISQDEVEKLVEHG